MKTIAVQMDDDLNTALEQICAQRKLDKSQVAADLLRRYVETERLIGSLRDPALMTAYQELATEDVNLAEQGMGEFQQLLGEADQK
jgi:predicted transcriptional regulator